VRQTLLIRHLDDETFSILVDGEEVGWVNHDDHGWAGMKLAEDLARGIAKVADMKVVVET
jgi:hypothetical protein